MVNENQATMDLNPITGAANNSLDECLMTFIALGLELRWGLKHHNIPRLGGAKPVADLLHYNAIACLQGWRHGI